MSAATRAESVDPANMVAALDLGSNSFHLIVASLAHGRLQIVDRIKDMVRLAAALDDDNRIDHRRAEPAVAALRRYGERLRMLPLGNVRAVGTNTLRKARNAAWFMREAEQALGHPLEIISGREEARLIYVGVAHSLAPSEERRLVVDIGGGSTELVVGRGVNPGACDSLYMGCVEITRRFMGDGRITGKAFKRARLAALQELETVMTRFSPDTWEVALGSSGTIRSVLNVATALGFADDALTPAALAGVQDALLSHTSIDTLALPGLPTQRQPVFPGGVAILSAVFEALGIQRMLVSPGALREGLLYELIGRIDRVDVREHTVDSFQDRYQIDRQQARRVLNTAMFLFCEVQEPWQLDDDTHGLLLGWAAQLHEIGLSVSHSQYHKHGAYLLANMDMPGFSRSDQARVAVLVRAHRRKFPAEEFDQFPDADAQALWHLAMLLRIAALLHRSRSDAALPLFQVNAGNKRLELVFPDGWLDEHPLTRLDLDQESTWLASVGYELVVQPGSDSS